MTRREPQPPLSPSETGGLSPPPTTPATIPEAPKEKRSPSTPPSPKGDPQKREKASAVSADGVGGDGVPPIGNKAGENGEIGREGDDHGEDGPPSLTRRESRQVSFIDALSTTLGESDEGRAMSETEEMPGGSAAAKGGTGNEDEDFLVPVDGSRRLSNQSQSRRWSTAARSWTAGGVASAVCDSAGGATTAESRGSRRSSLALRKVPEHILLGRLDDESTDSDDDNLFREEPRKEAAEDENKEKGSLLRRTCLRPSFSLRTQMMLSFGLVSSFTILFVVAISALISVNSGHRLKSTSMEKLEEWAHTKATSNAVLVAEAFTLMLPANVINILSEALRDRFVGYPDVEGYAEDLYVPFSDIESDKNKYPLDAHPLNLDWDINANVNSSNFAEHVQDRWKWYSNNPRLSTSAAMFHMQGVCDPSITDPGHINYYPNCTDANNDFKTGGVVQPTFTNENIYRKTKDLHPILKSLYEYYQPAKSVGIYFANAGAGATVMFPHYEIDFTQSYTSIGCGWMNNTNPYDNEKTIGTPEMISRCHLSGKEVFNSEYNPMERGWCRDQALEPERVHFIGPYLDAWSEHVWQLVVGKAVYDRRTNEFIGCTLIDINLEVVNDLLGEVTISKSGQIALVNWDDGTVVSSPSWNSDKEKEATTVGSLGLGISGEDFHGMKDQIDFSVTWDPKSATEKYEKNLRINGKVISGHPVPAIPTEYDPNYRPYFMVILSIDENEVFQSFYDLDEAVDDKVRGLVVFTVIAGAVGLLVVLILISTVALSLTRPLQWMNDVSMQIVDQFGDETKQVIDAEHHGVFRCSPRTELSTLMEEFKKMISKFSCDGTAAKNVGLETQSAEIRNKFTLLDEFESLYKSRKNDSFVYNYKDKSLLGGSEVPRGRSTGGSSKITWESNEDKSDMGKMPCRRHFGPILVNSDSMSRSASVVMKKDNVLKSPLFRWIVGLVVAPLLIVTITISSVVLYSVSKQFARMDAIVQNEYLQLEQRAMNTSANLLAKQASRVTEEAVKDLHVLTRSAGWLLFGGLNRSDAFPKMYTRAEQCNDAPSAGSCNRDGFVCDCEWKDTQTSFDCQKYNETEDTRYAQQPMWMGQNQDTSLPNGDYNRSTYPKVAASPQTTSFWTDPTKVPGWEKGQLSKGYETTYDRLRTIAALSAIFMPLFNHGYDARSLGFYISFEADGMFGGYEGCGLGEWGAFWKSSEENGAPEINPNLCPKGKYGFDPRCRWWYAKGKEKWNYENTPLYVTPPYVYPYESVSTAQSCTAPLVDPVTGNHVGQTLVDFTSNSIFKYLNHGMNGGFPILITTSSGIAGDDTVIGPDFQVGDPPQAIEDVVMGKRCVGDECADGFYKIVEDMRKGGRNLTDFKRLDKKVFISYAPVRVKNFQPLESSDFSRGVNESNTLIYSLAVAQPEEALLGPFREVESGIQRQVGISIAVIAILIVFASALLIYISSRVTVAIIVPILHLLRLIKNMNRLENKDEVLPPQDEFGSCEIIAVYGTMSMLFTVLRLANSAFFSGDIKKAYQVLVDSLALFKRLGNKKAIGIASNNLGNCMLTFYRALEETGDYQICRLTKEDIISKGIAYFREAIKLGEEAYDKFYEEEGWSGNCLVFMQHLSNRYFNRAMFLLTTRKDHKRSDEAENSGIRDLEISRDMDIEISDQCLEVGFSIDKVEHFELMLRRIRGLLSLLELSYPEEWDVGELIDQVFNEIRAALKNPTSSGLFDGVSPAGRMQQVDAELIRYARIRNETEEAARIGIRMLIEDEYVLFGAAFVASEALMSYVDAMKDKALDSITQQTRKDLQTCHSYLMEDFSHAISARLTQVQKLEETTLRLSKTRLSDAVITSSRTPGESFRGDFTMEVF